MPGAAARRARRRSQLLRRFREAGATDIEHAVTLDQLGQQPSSTFDHLLQEGVFRQVADDRFYIDEGAASEFENNQRHFNGRFGDFSHRRNFYFHFSQSKEMMIEPYEFNVLSGSGGPADYSRSGIESFVR
jgi:hypothetical protein